MRLVLGDDHRMFLDALGAGLERRGHDVLGMTECLDELVDLVACTQPELCILDNDFGGRSVVASVAAIRSRQPGVRTVLLAGAAPTEVWAAFDARLIDGVVNKLCDINVLNRAIERVLRGERVVERFDQPRPRSRSTSAADLLSGQEREVVRLLVRGASTDQIAAALGVSTHTVRSHVQGVFQKLGVNSRAKAARVALALGVTDAASDRFAG